jgi:hypothetical protein
MADNAFISAPSGMSNAQQGTRGLSAGDWVRLQRLRGARSNGYSNSSTNGLLTSSSPIYNKDVVPPQFPQQYYLGGSINVFSTTGTSKIRRAASNWTDYVASQTADYVLTSQAATTSPSVTNTVAKVCGCTAPTYSVKKIGVCMKCNGAFTHVRIM